MGSSVPGVAATALELVIVAAFDTIVEPAHGRVTRFLAVFRCIFRHLVFLRNGTISH